MKRSSFSLISIALAATVLFTLPTQAFDIGVNYHAWTSNFTQDSFLPEYHTGDVRNEVQEQLEDMADAGVDHIFTRIAIGAPPDSVVTAAGNKINERTNRYHFAFPPTSQDLINLDNYIADVTALGMTLDLGLIWEGQANFEQGCVDKYDDPSCMEVGLGSAKLPPAIFKSTTHATFQRLFTSIDPGEVRTFYFDTEAQYDQNLNIHPPAVKRIRRNQNWFFENAYVNFSLRCANHAPTRPSLYFLFTAPTNLTLYPRGILDNEWRNLPDPEHPATEGHRTMFNAYRSVRFIYDTVAAKGWPATWLPPRFELSIYADTDTPSLYDDHIRRIVEDAMAVFVDNPDFNFSGVAAAEMGFLDICTERQTLWDALQFQGLESVSFWTTPYKGARVDPYGNRAWSHITDFDGGSINHPQDPNICW